MSKEAGWLLVCNLGLRTATPFSIIYIGAITKTNLVPSAQRVSHMNIFPPNPPLSEVPVIYFQVAETGLQTGKSRR